MWPSVHATDLVCLRLKQSMPPFLLRLVQSRFFVTAVGFLSGMIWVGVFHGVDHSILLSPASIRHETGHAYIVEIPLRVHLLFQLRGDTGEAPLRAALQLFEGERQLGPGHSQHQDIRDRGEGRFSHWGNSVYFSATDNTQPAQNGRVYRAVSRAKLPLWIGVATTIITYWLVLARSGGRIPPLEHPGLSRAVFGIFLLAIVAHAPGLWTQAANADATLSHAIPTVGDDGGYQILAVNLLHGLGYSSQRLLPNRDYRLHGPAGEATTVDDYSRERQFRRSPGLPLMLACAYKLFGPATIVAQRMMAMLTWLTALLLLVTGAVLAGWAGSLAGGLSALYHLNYFPGTYNFERLLSENPTAFWVALFGLAFTLFLKRASTITAAWSAASLAGLILMRVNFFPVLPLLVVYLMASKWDWRRVVLFAVVATLPLTLWSAYASASMGRPVLITMAGPQLFAHTNNLDTLEGIGPERWNQGGWNPGFYSKGDGTWGTDFHNQVKTAENGWLKGLGFWRDNFSRVPQLFFVKLRVGFWFANGTSANGLHPEGFFLIGIGYLVIALGFLPVKLPWVSAVRLTPDRLLASQILVLSTLFLLWNRHGLLPVLIVWLLLLCLSLLRLNGQQQPLPFPNPVWFGAFVASHAITTILFYGIRFHLPLDSNLLLVCFLGMLLTVYETARRGGWLTLYFLSVALLTVLEPVA